MRPEKVSGGTLYPFIVKQKSFLLLSLIRKVAKCSSSVLTARTVTAEKLREYKVPFYTVIRFLYNCEQALIAFSVCEFVFLRFFRSLLFQINLLIFAKENMIVICILGQKVYNEDLEYEWKITSTCFSLLKQYYVNLLCEMFTKYELRYDALPISIIRQ